jgi:hypothetical protein
MGVKNKQGENGEVVRNKVRLVAQDFSQVEGLDFGKTFAPVTHLEVIRILHLQHSRDLNSIKWM